MSPSTKSEGQSLEAGSIARLLEGAEDWDWDDMLDFMSPTKPNPKSVRKQWPQLPQRPFQKDLCTRCIVESLSEVNDRSHKVGPSFQSGPPSTSWSLFTPDNDSQT